MRSTFFKSLFLLVAILLLSATSPAKVNPREQHTLLTMRMIGHQILLVSCDSTSRVMPVEDQDGRYKIQFETDFQFNPDDLVVVIDSIMSVSQVACHYIVEVVDCENDKVVYGYEMKCEGEEDFIPCRSRDLHHGCFQIYISILERSEFMATASGNPNQLPNGLSTLIPGKFLIWAQFIPVFLLIVMLYLMLKRKRKTNIQNELINIGKYKLDKKNMNLIFENSKIELTNTEADLLALLHESANDTLDRDVILNRVWGDNGDYVGRTLDVFISKLRAKLGSDDNVRIVNIRGKGYKLVLND
ncbi:MAG: winged helix-turn-helix transcriptional regulator [Saprospiraceae bacterium]|nr:winged helix-turn-helix transcriptional regulator [Saprospiraceae bacterium]